MHIKAKALLDAHVAHVISNFGPDKLPGVIREETAFIWDQLDGVKLNEVLTREEILDFQKRNFEHREKMSDPAKTYAKSLRDAVIEHLRSNETTLADVIEKKDYDALIKEISGLRRIREEIIHTAVSNPLYAEVIANILADGIKSFTSEEGFAGKIPGASSLFKMGQGLLGGLQDSIDRSIRKFITENIQKLTNQSERFIQDLIDDKKVRELGEKLWQRTSSRPVSAAVAKFDASEFDDFEPIVENLANQVLRSEFAAELNEVVIDHFMAENGDKSLQELLLDVEITKEDVLRESEEFFVKVSGRALKDGSLEARVRIHLSAFYGSGEVAKILK